MQPETKYHETKCHFILALILFFKVNIVLLQEPEIIQGVAQFESLKVRVGEDVANMCKKMNIYWLTEAKRVMVPEPANRLPVPPQRSMVPSHRQPEVVPHPKFALPVPVSDIGTPPPRPHSGQHGHRHEFVPQLIPHNRHNGIPSLGHQSVPQRAPHAPRFIPVPHISGARGPSFMIPHRGNMGRPYIRPKMKPEKRSESTGRRFPVPQRLPDRGSPKIVPSN